MEAGARTMTVRTEAGGRSGAMEPRSSAVMRLVTRALRASARPAPQEE